MLTLQQIQAVCPSLVEYREPLLSTATPQSLPSPGVGLKHYSPRARLILVDEDIEKIVRLGRELQAAGEAVGIMLPGARDLSSDFLIFPWGALDDQDQLAHRLFAGLRELDAAGASVILCPLPANEGLGVAIRDRLQKAAR